MLEILGSIVFMAALIVETTSLKLDKIAAGHESDTALTRAMIAHRTSMYDLKTRSFIQQH